MGGNSNKPAAPVAIPTAKPPAPKKPAPKPKPPTLGVGGIPINAQIAAATESSDPTLVAANPEVAAGSPADSQAKVRLAAEMKRRGRSSLSIPLAGAGFQSGGVFIPYY